jgi:hypothetical protein
MVPIPSDLLLYFISEVHVCCFSHVIRDDLLVIVRLIIVWISVFAWRRFQHVFETLWMFVFTDNEKSPIAY